MTTVHAVPSPSHCRNCPGSCLLPYRKRQAFILHPICEMFYSQGKVKCSTHNYKAQNLFNLTHLLFILKQTKKLPKQTKNLESCKNLDIFCCINASPFSVVSALACLLTCSITQFEKVDKKNWFVRRNLLLCSLCLVATGYTSRSKLMQSQRKASRKGLNLSLIILTSR